ncbi:hypothetical protein CGCVW01_v004382 [Colletotrichum viniferum]|nr:hypothetical protein CGCVW01_v004382 [Colletotrichum viniferum]
MTVHELQPLHLHRRFGPRFLVLSPSHLYQEPTDDARWLLRESPANHPPGLQVRTLSLSHAPPSAGPNPGLRFEDEGNEPIIYVKTFRLETRAALGGQSDPVFDVTAQDDHDKRCEHLSKLRCVVGSHWLQLYRENPNVGCLTRRGRGADRDRRAGGRSVFSARLGLTTYRGALVLLYGS